MLSGLRPQRHSVEVVFTPRRTDVNREIYVDRPSLERQLRTALQGSLHAIVFGESGSGKSWLYKKVLADLGAQFANANCANASRYESLTTEIAHVVAVDEPKRVTEQSDEMNTVLKAVIAEGGLKSTKKYAFAESDPIMDCFRVLREKAGSGLAVLVIDNLEMIFHSEPLMKELASIIILLDDPRYSQFGVKLLIVGVPSGVRHYLSKTYASVSNRLTEVSEVSNLTRSEVDKLVETGFLTLLRMKVEADVLSAWKEHIYKVTMGFAQPVQEYCEQLGYLVREDGDVGKIQHLREADKAWLTRGLQNATGLIAEWMNERETKVGRRNQVLYSIGKINKRSFTVSEVESIVRNEFSQSMETYTTLAVGQILNELGTGEGAIIKRSSKGPNFEFRDARAAMALRVLLEKDSRGRVIRIDQS